MAAAVDRERRTSPVGAAKISGLIARGEVDQAAALAEYESTSFAVVPEHRLGGLDERRLDLRGRPRRRWCCAQERDAARRRAALAMLVPSSGPHGPPWPVGSDEMIATPGALTSGFSFSDTGVGPADEKSRDHVGVRDRGDGDRRGRVAGRATEP